MKKTAWTFQVWFMAAFKAKSLAYDGSLAGKEHYRQKSRFHERKVARKPAMLPQTNLLKCMRSSDDSFPLILSPRCHYLLRLSFIRHLSRSSIAIFQSINIISLRIEVGKAYFRRQEKPSYKCWIWHFNLHYKYIVYMHMFHCLSEQRCTLAKTIMALLLS